MGSSPHGDRDAEHDDHRRTPIRGRPAITDITIARVETVTMTDLEYADAVEALAVLIARYERHQEEHLGTAA